MDKRPFSPVLWRLCSNVHGASRSIPAVHLFFFFFLFFLFLFLSRFIHGCTALCSVYRPAPTFRLGLPQVFSFGAVTSAGRDPPPPFARLAAAARADTIPSRAQLALAAALRLNNKRTIINVQSIRLHPGMENRFAQFRHRQIESLICKWSCPFFFIIEKGCICVHLT